jgi:hypothetical protein
VCLLLRRVARRLLADLFFPFSDRAFRPREEEAFFFPKTVSDKPKEKIMTSKKDRRANLCVLGE